MKLQNTVESRLNNLNTYYLKFFNVACTLYNKKHAGEYLDPEQFVRNAFNNYYNKGIHKQVKTTSKAIKSYYTNLLSDCIGTFELDILKVVESIQENNTYKMSQAPISEIPEEIEDLFFEDSKQYKSTLKQWFKTNKELIQNKYYNLVIVPM